MPIRDLFKALLGRPLRTPIPTPQPVTAEPTSDRYKGKPLLMLFESFVLDVLGYLPPSDSENLLRITPTLRSTFNVSAQDWRAIVREVLHLSPTIDVAILDLWYRNSDVAKERARALDPHQFARGFCDHFLEEGSTIDVWPSGALEEATARVSVRRRSTQ